MERRAQAKHVGQQAILQASGREAPGCGRQQRGGERAWRRAHGRRAAALGAGSSLEQRERQGTAGRGAVQRSQAGVVDALPFNPGAQLLGGDDVVHQPAGGQQGDGRGALGSGTRRPRLWRTTPSRLDTRSRRLAALPRRHQHSVGRRRPAGQAGTSRLMRRRTSGGGRGRPACPWVRPVAPGAIFGLVPRPVRLPAAQLEGSGAADGTGSCGGWPRAMVGSSSSSAGAPPSTSRRAPPAHHCFS